jgi:hypothetical protein
MSIRGRTLTVVERKLTHFMLLSRRNMRITANALQRVFLATCSTLMFDALLTKTHQKSGANPAIWIVSLKIY